MPSSLTLWVATLNVARKALVPAILLGLLTVAPAALPPVCGEEPPPETKHTGHPFAPGIVKLMEDEVQKGLKARAIDGDFARFRAYAAERLDSTRRSVGFEVTGNCRLRWYDHLLRNPVKATGEAEQFTRQLHENLCGDAAGVLRALATAREKMDLPSQPELTFTPPSTPEEALTAVQQALTSALAGYKAAVAPLSRGEAEELGRSLNSIFTIQTNVGHTVMNQGAAHRLCDLMEKMDRGSLYSAAEALAPLSDAKLLEQLAALPDEGEESIAGVTGKVLKKIVTPAGTIVVGGREKNTYALDEMPGVAAVIDLGGDDLYKEGAVSAARPLLVLIDLAGNDQYRGSRPGIQGSAVLGVSMLVDAQGNDVYVGRDVVQGSCLAGVGMLIDRAGDDFYSALRRAQGQALGGLGLLLDAGGDDQYHAAMWDQGFGGPLGLGVLEDADGKDSYYTGGLYPDSYPETPGYEGWGQGVGAGLRGVADGGIGVLLDGGGDDTYQFDYMGHGGGYWLGLGFARDFAGNDRRLGATEKAFNGGARAERRFQRFGCGFGCHYALGFCFDDEGNDTYHGTIMGTGFAWDLSVGVLCDFAGNDHYTATGGGTQGNGAQAGLGILFDYDGDDRYDGTGQGYASWNISYHPLPTCGGNFSFVIDYGGNDKYGCGARNNLISQRASPHGFVIDRPRRDETATTPKASPASTTPPSTTPSSASPSSASPSSPSPSSTSPTTKSTSGE